MGIYFYVIAAAMAVLGVLFFFKTNVEKMKENPEVRGAAYNNFFIGVALSEVIPIALIVFAYATTDPVLEMNDVMLPGIIILLLMAVSMFFIFMQRAVGVPEESRNVVNQFSMIAIAIVNAVPIISLVFLFISAA